MARVFFVIGLLLACLATIYQYIGRGYLANPYGWSPNFVAVSLGIIMPVALWTIANWCLTTLFEGEGSMKDIFMVVCYSTIPYTFLTIVSTVLFNFAIHQEFELLLMLQSFAYVWLGILLFFGCMVVHDYSLGKNILTALGTIVGMGFIMFVALLFSSLLIRMVGFVNGIYLEVAYRL